MIDANELYRIFIRTGVDLKKIPLSEFDCFGDMPEANNKLHELLTPDAWEVTGMPQELPISVNGETFIAMKCNNLGQARTLLDAVTNKETNVSVISLFS